MRISYHLDDFLFDSEYCTPKSLSEVAHFVRAQDDYLSIIMLAKNSKKSAKYLYDQCVCLEEEEGSDMLLACLLVIIHDLKDPVFRELVSRISEGPPENHWSSSIAISSLLQEANNEKLCISA